MEIPFLEINKANILNKTAEAGLARNGERSIILGALLLCTLDIKIACLVLIFYLFLVLHAPLSPPRQKNILL